MNTILHLTDFSENACKALKYAYNLAEKLNAKLRVVHVSEVPSMMSHPHTSSFEEIEEQEKDSVLSRLRESCSESLGYMPSPTNISFEVKVDPSIIKGILDVIKENNANLIVVGSRGKSKAREIIMGSTTRKLISESTCPILVIPENASFREIRQIVYASDFDGHDKTVLEKLMTMAIKLDSTIKVLHVFSTELNHIKEADKFKQELEKEVKFTSLEYVALVSNNTAESILNYVKDIKPDLLVMFEKEKAGIVGMLFHQDLDQEFAIHSSIPLLSFNPLSLKSELL